MPTKTSAEEFLPPRMNLNALREGAERMHCYVSGAL